jgi:hypothetical protein
VTRSDVIAARAAALEFVHLSDQLLEKPFTTYDHDNGSWVEKEWRETWMIAGALSGAHRQSSLELSRVLSRMRWRS